MDDIFGEGHGYVRPLFRHTAASRLIWSGEKLDEIANHSSMSIEMLIRTYGHDHPEAEMAVVRAFTEGSAGHRKGRSSRERGLESPTKVACFPPAE
ncbi:hypothetical protein [Jiella avicenniae]|uniref:Phage integrase family protein n=1 Tax=Jiella avicenniae TaxID=2907202 RepID=A0A9X1P329_9HYPH|nr:hypothetical protein [Jiella avicenniae]MCE7030152.1 hypothetical protein [Jiella avicenniae]